MSPLERLEQLVEEHYGRGAAVSVDKRRVELAESYERTVVTIWNPKGIAISSTSCESKREAIATAIRALRGTP